MQLSYEHLVAECDRLGIHGLLFQHIHLCLTRTWLHYHRIDCAHLNRHMQTGLFIHATTYGGRGAQADLGFGLSHVVHLFHPEIIILGGGLSGVGEPLRAAVESALRGFIMEAFAPGPAVSLAALSEDVVPVGALELAREA